ncbi:MULTISPECIES: LuxR family transcriptional regulator [unclassified Streptomyces]|uniref:LuxR family transcriptional regulator n=1 Tax=unclassified Streptomyces TaxID=2593676 RepID=UPI00378A4C75
MSDPREDELEQALLAVKALIESSVTIHRDLGVQERLISSVDSSYNVVLEAAQGLINSATTSIEIVHARPVSTTERAVRRSDRAEQELLQGASADVSVRLLTTPALLDEEFVREQMGKERPVEIRVARMPPLQALIIDGNAGLVVAESAVGRRSSLIRVPEVLHALSVLFRNVWSDALPAGERLIFGDRERAALARRILAALQAGVTDEVAAREMMVSVRTYRRHVAEIMSLLGANSRFQAGARAAELNLLPPANGG